MFLYHGAVVGGRWPGHAAEGAALINGRESPTSGAHTHVHGFWVGMGSILLFMGGHGCVLFPGGYG